MNNFRQSCFENRLTLVDLRRDKRLDESVRCLRVQAQSVSQALQLRRLFQERLLQTVPASVEVLFDGVESHFENRALFR